MLTRMTRRSLVVGFALACASLPTALAGPAGAKDKVFVGYLFGRPRNLNFKLYTHLCHAFLTADADGELSPSRNIPDRAFVTDAHKANVKVLVSLGGWGWDKQFAAIVAKPDAEDRYVKAVMAVVEEGDYDGIDLDWEYPDTATEVAGFERLTRRFRAQLDAQGKTKGRAMIVTMAASSNPGTLRWLRKDFLLETMDWVNVMTYDYTGDWTDYAGHHAPLFASSKQPGGRERGRSTESSMKYLVETQGIPPDRLAVGIPLYGRGFAVSEPYASTKGKPKTRLGEGNFAALDHLRREQGWVRTWDDETKTPWLIAPDGATVVGYDDAESVRTKTEWALKRNFRGVFFWQVAADRLPDGSNPLQEASRKAWEEGIRPSTGRGPVP